MEGWGGGGGWLWLDGCRCSTGGHCAMRQGIAAPLVTPPPPDGHPLLPAGLPPGGELDIITSYCFLLLSRLPTTPSKHNSCTPLLFITPPAGTPLWSTRNLPLRHPLYPPRLHMGGWILWILWSAPRCVTPAGTPMGNPGPPWFPLTIGGRTPWWGPRCETTALVLTDEGQLYAASS